jgi:hypothetical protein
VTHGVLFYLKREREVKKKGYSLTYILVGCWMLNSLFIKLKRERKKGGPLIQGQLDKARSRYWNYYLMEVFLA